MGLRLAVFASGGGSNFRAIHNRAQAYKVALLVCNKTGAGALSIADRHDIPKVSLNPSAFDDEGVYLSALLEALRKHRVNFIALAGYLRKIPAQLVQMYHGRIVNIHPALLPDFGGKGYYGRRVHEAVIRAGVKFSGATIHFVDEEYDRGPIIMQQRVAVHPDDTPQTLARRVLEVEHSLYPETLNLIANDRVILSGRTVTILESNDDD